MSSQPSGRCVNSSRASARRRERVKSLLRAAAFAFIATAALPVHAQAQSLATPLSSAVGLCGQLDNAYGPYDFRSDKHKLDIVERFHFTPQVETLQRGQSGSLGSDLDYTLRAFPNHHRALYAMMRLAERSPAWQAKGARYPSECYFVRAVRFRPDDAQVHALYAFYLMKRKRPDEARRQLEEAAKLDPKDPQVLYNIGLGYADLKDYGKSLEFAHKAYGAGIDFEGLRERLRAAGHWREAKN